MGKETAWHAPLILAQVPETGLRVTIEADKTARAAMAQAAGLRHVTRASASFDIAPRAGDSFQVTGRVQGSVGQACVVTLEPLENEIDEAVDVSFAPQTVVQSGEAAGKRRGSDGNEEDEVRDPPEPIVKGQIDLGRLAQEFLFLGIDPYPRKDGAAFDVPETPPDPEDHPFAALKELKGKGD